ncbi:hypothetical protein LA080_011537 [Diaporthe eres]|nr:hypothetical protein LA080_011537 [Diaporthe eres]
MDVQFVMRLKGIWSSARHREVGGGDGDMRRPLARVRSGKAVMAAKGQHRSTAAMTVCKTTAIHPSMFTVGQSLVKVWEGSRRGRDELRRREAGSGLRQPS